MACDGGARAQVSQVMVGLASVAVLLVFWPFLAHATVYSWREGGVLMMSNSPEDVPENKRASVQSFTSKPASRRARGRRSAVHSERGGRRVGRLSARLRA